MGRDPLALFPSPVHWFATKGRLHLGGILKDAAKLGDLPGQLPGWDIYATLNRCRPRYGSIRARREDVEAVRAIILDVDPVGDHPSPGEAAAAFLEGAEAILGVRISPAIIDTGRGYHLWIMLAADKEADKKWEDRARWLVHKINGSLGIQMGCRVDRACSDLPRLVRLPGSTNQRTGRVAELQDEGGPNEIPEESWRESESESNVLWRHPTNVAKELELTLFQGVGLVPREARRFLLDGAAEGERNNLAFLAAVWLADLGFGESTILEAVRYGSAMSRPRLEDREASACVRSAMRRQGSRGTLP